MKIALFARGRWAFLLTASLLFALLTAAPASALATDWRRLCESGTPSEVQEALRTSSADELLPGGSRPLHVAAEYARNPEVVRLLLKHGASLTSVGLEGLTPLMLAAAYNPNPAVAEALLAAGASTDVRDEKGRTPVFLLAVSRLTLSKSIAIPRGNPSTTPPTASPCDEPNVVRVSFLPKVLLIYPLPSVFQ